MAEFTYNNTMNANISYIVFELNYDYHPRISFEKDINLYFQSNIAKNLTSELKNLMTSC